LPLRCHIVAAANLAAHRTWCKKHASRHVGSNRKLYHELQIAVPPRKNMPRLVRIFPAQLQAFQQIRALIDEFGALSNLGHEDRHKLTLIVEELFTNTITHGHRGDSDAPVSISFQHDNGEMELVYEDSAPPFDPLAAGRRTDIESTIKERRIGGLGIFITVGLTDGANYSYADGRNRICLKFSVTGK
jgi:serine/threonine-protein kinase RsbW